MPRDLLQEAEEAAQPRDLFQEIPPTLGERSGGAALSAAQAAMTVPRMPFAVGRWAGNLVSDRFESTLPGIILREGDALFQEGSDAAQALKPPVIRAQEGQHVLFDESGQFDPQMPNATQLINMPVQSAGYLLPIGGGGMAVAKGLQQIPRVTPLVADMLGYGLAAGTTIGGETFSSTERQARDLMKEDLPTPESVQAGKTAAAIAAPISAATTAAGFPLATRMTGGVPARFVKGSVVDAPFEAVEEGGQAYAEGRGLQPITGRGVTLAEIAERGALGAIAQAPQGGVMAVLGGNQAVAPPPPPAAPPPLLGHTPQPNFVAGAEGPAMTPQQYADEVLRRVNDGLAEVENAVQGRAAIPQDPTPEIPALPAPNQVPLVGDAQGRVGPRGAVESESRRLAETLRALGLDEVANTVQGRVVPPQTPEAEVRALPAPNQVPLVGDQSGQVGTQSQMQGMAGIALRNAMDMGLHETGRAVHGRAGPFDTPGPSDVGPADAGPGGGTAQRVTRPPQPPQTSEWSDVTLIDPDEIAVDAQTFQFKSGGDQEGVTQQLRGTRQWDPKASGVSIVWERNDGQKFIVDGHQRLGLAKRLKQEGQTPMMRALVLREADGISPADARLAGAIKNLQEGGESTSAVDVARVIRDSGDMEAVRDVIPPNRAAYREGRALAALGDDAWGMVVNEQVNPSHAAVVAEKIKDHGEQVAALDVFQRTPPANLAQARFMTDQIVQAGFEKKLEDSQGDILGGTASRVDNLVGERAKVLDNAIRRLRGMRSAFRNAVVNQSSLESAGNVLDSETNQSKVKENAELIVTLQQLANTAGPISSALTDAARALHGGASPQSATSDFLETIARGPAESDSGSVAGDQAGELDQEPVRQPGPGLFGDEPPAEASEYPGAPDDFLGDGVSETPQEEPNERRTSAVRDPQGIPVQQSLFDGASIPDEVAKEQVSDNFLVRYEQIKTGEIRSGFDRVTSPEEAAHVFAPLRKASQEQFFAAVVDDTGKVLHIINHSKGTPTGSAVTPPIIAGAAVATPGARGIWMGHGHPSGVPTPSGADQQVTREVQRVLEGTGLTLHGHVVVGAGTDAYFIDKEGRETPIAIKPAVRQRTIPLTEFMLRQRRKQPAAITSQQLAQEAVDRLNTKNGILLMDNRHRPSGVVAMSADEMMVLREGGRVGRIMAAIVKTNAQSVLIFSSDPQAARNVERFLGSQIRYVRVLDILAPAPGAQDSSAVSWAQEGRLLGGGGAWYSRRPRTPQGAAYTRTIDAIRQQWPNAPEIRFVDNIDALRRAVPNAPDDVEAAFVEGVVYVVEDRISSDADLTRKVAHEVVGHYGVRGVMSEQGSGALDRLLDDVWRAYEEGQTDPDSDLDLRNIAHDYDLDLNNQADRRTASEEYLARLAEQGRESRWLDKLRVLLAKMLRLIDAKMPLSKAEVNEIIAKARGYVSRPGPRGDGGQPAWMRGYHGSPHKFDEFDSSKIGTGEGAQAFGHGLYLSESEGVGRAYYEAGSDVAWLVGDRRLSADDLGSMPPAEKHAIQLLATYGDAAHNAAAQYKPDVRDAIQALEGVTVKKEYDGALYEVDIPDAMIDRMLDWDAPLSEQPDAIKSALFDAMGDVKPVQLGDGRYAVTRIHADGASSVNYAINESSPEAAMQAFREHVLSETGGGAYFDIAGGTEVTPGASQAAASTRLKELGIPGIKYRAGQLSGVDSDAKNFVVFPGEEKNLTILTRNGEPVTPKQRAQALDDLGEQARYSRRPQDFSLEQPTQEGLQEADERAAQAEREQAEADREAARRAKADRERGEFELTGSDLPADSKPRQGALFSRRPSPSQQTQEKVAEYLHDAWNALRGAGAQGRGEGRVTGWHKTVGTPFDLAHRDEDYARFFWATQDYLAAISSHISQAEALMPSWFNVSFLKAAKEKLEGKESQDAQRVTDALIRGTLQDQRVYDDAALQKLGLTQREIKMYHEARAVIDRQLDKMAAALVKQGGDAKEIAARTRNLKKQGYFPLSRFGNNYVEIRDPQGQVVDFRLYGTKVEAGFWQQRLERMYGKGFTSRRGTVPKLKGYDGLSLASIEAFADLMGVAKDSAFQEYLKHAVAQRSALKRMIHRKGTAGFSKDGKRILADFIVSTSRFAAKGEHFTDMERAIEGSESDGIRGISAGDLKDYAREQFNYLKDPTEEHAALRGYLFFHFLGGNVASALVNLSQTPMLTLPYLSQYASAKEAAGLLTKAITDAGTYAAKPDSLTGDLGAALRRAEDAGVTNAQNTYQMMALAAGSRLSRIGEWSQALDAWAFMFSEAEKLNRRTAFIAAYRLARRQGKKGQAAYDFAVQAVDETQFIYNKGNRPRWARGALSVPFTFKIFSVSMLEAISRLPNQQKAMILAAMALMSGLEGLPFAEDIEDLIDTIGQKLGYNTNSKRWLQKTLESTFEEGMGLPPEEAAVWAWKARSGFLGRRLGMGNLIPGTGMFKTSEDDKTGEMSEALGPAAGLVEGVQKGAEQLSRGRPGRAVEKAAPRGVANLMAGFRLLDEGEETTADGYKVTDVGPHEAIQKALGWQPEVLAAHWDDVMRDRQTIEFHRRKEDEILDQWVDGLRRGDADRVQGAMKKLADYNRKNDALPIVVTPTQIQQRYMQQMMPAAVRSMRMTPPELRGALQ